MATPISQLSGSFVTYATTNLLVVVDVTDTSMAGSGTDKKITVGSFISNYSIATLPGSTSITTLGTITTGAWNGSIIGASYLTAMGASGVSHSAGIVPDPGATPGTSRYLREDATWQVVTSNPGTVTSVTFTGDGTVLSSTPSSAVTSSGTLTASLLTQSANRVLAGPTTGSAANPTFRALVSADLPTITSLGTVTTGVWQGSVIAASYLTSMVASGASHSAGIVPDPGASAGTTKYLREDASWQTAVSSITFTGDGTVLSSTPSSAITTSGTIAASLLTQSANRVLAGPTTGAAVAPTFRALVAADIPVFVASGASHAAGGVPDPGASAGTTKYLREDSSWQTAVTSITFTGDGTVLSSTPSAAITTSGTVAASLLTQSANKVFSGPTSGGAVAPTFRSLVAGDIPATLNPTTIAAGSDVAVAILKANSTQTADLLTIESSTPTVQGGVSGIYAPYGSLAEDVITGRLTLSSTLPVYDGTSSTNIYYLPYKGRGCVTLYNTTSSQYENRFFGTSGLSLSLTGYSASKPHDIFIYDNAGTLTLEKVAWTSTSARATAIVNAGDYWYKTGAQGHRYLGTAYVDGSGVVSDSLTSRSLWNVANRASKAYTWAYLPNTNPFVITNGSNVSTGVYGVINDAGSNPLQVYYMSGLANQCALMASVSCVMQYPAASNQYGWLGMSTSSSSYTHGNQILLFLTSAPIIHIMTATMPLGLTTLYALAEYTSTTINQICYYYAVMNLTGMTEA